MSANQWTMLGRAIALASKQHMGVMDKGGKPYILHPLRIMNTMPDNDPELRQIAVLHDVVEDTDVTFSDLIDQGYSGRVIDALAALTHSPQDSYILYIKTVKSNPDAVKVKLGDLKDNSDITRLKGVKEKDLKRIEKYHRAYLYLSDRMSEYEYLGEMK